MDNRTTALLLLFAGALLTTGVLLSMVLSVADGSPMAGPWLAPVFAIACHTGALFLGRRYILPWTLADAPARAAVALALVVSLTLGATLALLWVLARVLGAWTETPGIALPLWFALLWLVLPRPGALTTRAVDR